MKFYKVYEILLLLVYNCVSVNYFIYLLFWMWIRVYLMWFIFEILFEDSFENKVKYIKNKVELLSDL